MAPTYVVRVISIYLFGFANGFALCGWVRDKAASGEKDQRQLDRQTKEGLDTRKNVVNRFANIVDKSDLARHYEVKHSTHHLGTADYLSFVRTSDKARVADVEVNFFRRDGYHVIIRTGIEGQGWPFGSDQRSLEDASSHLNQGLRNLAV
jgi:hypothetical protein